MATTLYARKYMLLSSWGFMNWEARELARNYNLTQLRTLPYLLRMSRARRLYVYNLKHQGLKMSEIRDRIYALYETKDWLDNSGVPSVWEMLRYYRKTSMAQGEYFPPSRKGTHHPPSSGISKGDLKSQKQRRKTRLSELEKYDRGRMR
jgi:hypothetical protein